MKVKQATDMSQNNPVRWSQIEDGMTPAEKRFADCVAQGAPCNLGNAVPQDETPDNQVRAEVIRFFVFGGDEEHPVRGVTIDLRGAWVVETLDLDFAQIPFALVFLNCHFVESIFTRQTRCVSLYLDRTLLAGGLMGNGLQASGDVFLRNGFSSQSEVRLVGAHIGRNLECDGGKFNNPNGYTINADGVEVSGSLFLRDGFSSQGEVRLPGAHIRGDLDCSGGKFVNLNANGKAITADNVRVGGGLFLRKCFASQGEVRLLGAHIGGNWECDGGKFNNPKGNAISADGAEVGGCLFLRNGFSSQGDVRLLGARIGGNVECNDGEFNNPKGVAINLQNAEVKDWLIWRNVAGGGVVYLAFAKASVLVDEVDEVHGGKSPSPSFKMRLNGFTYNWFSHPGSASSRLRWLANRPADVEFSSLPFEQAARVLFAMDRDDDARKILLRKEHEKTKLASFFGRKIPRRLWWLLAGYGYRLWLTLLWSVGIISAGALIFHCASQSGNIVPHQPVVLANAEYLKCCASGERPTEVVEQLFPDYPHFNAITFSVDVFIPFFALHQEPYWYPRPKDAGTDWVAYLLLGWYWFEIIMGWILTSLLLLSITGLLRPRQHSGKD